jgi:hypothetical protein
VGEEEKLEEGERGSACWRKGGESVACAAGVIPPDSEAILELFIELKVGKVSLSRYIDEDSSPIQGED